MEINTKYDYVRTQESDYLIEFQKQQLIEDEIEEKNIFVETKSSNKETKNRFTLQKLINQKLKKNDLLMIRKIRVCSWNTLEFIKLPDILFKRKIIFVALDLANNKVMSRTLSGIAEFKKNRQRECQKQGILAAKKKKKV